MKPSKISRLTKNLFEAILALETPAEAKNFFRDLCTVDELKEMSERWEIVKLLNKDWPYRKIAKKLQISTTTVSRVALWLYNGTGGYQSMLKRLNHHHKPTPSGKGLR